jgi:hypothetical protein
MVHPEKPNDTVPALPMRDNSRAHSGEKCEEMVRRNGVIRVFRLQRNHTEAKPGNKGNKG